MSDRRTLTIVLGAAAALLGIASIVSTFAAGGGVGSVGVVAGLTLAIMGSIRVWIATKGV